MDIERLLRSVAAGETSVADARERIEGYSRVDDFARLDLGRGDRTGVPEVVLADGKTPSQVADIAAGFLAAGDRVLVSRVDDDQRAALEEFVATDEGEGAGSGDGAGESGRAGDRDGAGESGRAGDRDGAGESGRAADAGGTDGSARTGDGGGTRGTAATMEWHDRARVAVLSTPAADPPATGGSVAVVSGGTADVPVAEEAAVTAREMGASVATRYDVGVAGIHRLLGEVETLDAADCTVVAAGREGALPTVVAGLVDGPVVGLPVSVGYGHAGDGEAALASMLQSCAVLSVVNIDAGVVAGAQAAQIARSG